MRQVNCNYKRNNTETKFALCKESEDTTEHGLECKNAIKFTPSKQKSKGEWQEIIKIYKKTEKKR